MVVAEVIQSDKVTRGEVENVYVVADSGTIAGCIIYGQRCQ